MDEDDTPGWERQANGYVRLKKELNEPEEREEKPANSIPVPQLGGVMHTLLIKRLTELEKEANLKSGIIRFPVVFEKICRNFSVNKKDAWEILFHLSELKVIRIVPYQGIVIKNQKNG